MANSDKRDITFRHILVIAAVQPFLLSGLVKTTAESYVQAWVLAALTTKWKEIWKDKQYFTDTDPSSIQYHLFMRAEA